MSEGLVIKEQSASSAASGAGRHGPIPRGSSRVVLRSAALKQIVSDLQDNPRSSAALHEAQMMVAARAPAHREGLRRRPRSASEPTSSWSSSRGSDLGTLLRERDRFSYEETPGSAKRSPGARLRTRRRPRPPRHRWRTSPGGTVGAAGRHRLRHREGGREGARRGRLHQDRSFIGTLSLPSREQIRAEKGAPVDGRADVYSLGVVLLRDVDRPSLLEGMAELKIASCVGYQDDWRPPLTFPGRHSR